MRLIKSSGAQGKNCLKAGAEARLQLRFSFFFFFKCLGDNLSQLVCVRVAMCMRGALVYQHWGGLGISRWAASGQVGSSLSQICIFPLLDIVPPSSGFSARLLSPLLLRHSGDPAAYGMIISAAISASRQGFSYHIISLKPR